MLVARLTKMSLRQEQKLIECIPFKTIWGIFIILKCVALTRAQVQYCVKNALKVSKLTQNERNLQNELGRPNLSEAIYCGYKSVSNNNFDFEIFFI